MSGLCEKELVIPILSDLHIYGTDDSHFQAQLKALRELRKESGFDALISLGDIPAMLGRERHASDEEIKALLHETTKMLSEAAEAPVLSINGNHDGIGTDFFSPILWNDSVGREYERGLCVHDRENVWFHADFAKVRLRMIFLSVPHRSKLSGEYPTPLWSFGEEQLDWLSGVVGSIPEGWRAIVFSHVPLCSEYAGDMESTLRVWDGEAERDATIASLCGWIEDRKKAEDILNSSGKIICAIGGHEHYDDLFGAGEEKRGYVNRLNFPQVVVSSHRMTEKTSEQLFASCGTRIVCVPAEGTVSLKLLIVGREA